MYHNSDITRQNPSCFLFLIDQSSSMAQKFGDRVENASKAEGVALALNNLLRNLIITCSKSDGIRNYFDVGVIGYGATVGPAWVGALTGQQLVPIRDVAHNFARMTGKPEDPKLASPVWVEPVAKGSTLMCQALDYTHKLLQQWLFRNPSCFPPVIVHITDGEATDGDPASLMAAIADLQSVNGKVTLFNVHLSSSREALPLSFPEGPEGLPDVFAKTLFERASLLTPYMRTVAWDHGITLGENSRAFVLNADPSLMVLALEIGTRPGNLW